MEPAAGPQVLAPLWQVQTLSPMIWWKCLSTSLIAKCVTTQECMEAQWPGTWSVLGPWREAKIPVRVTVVDLWCVKETAVGSWWGSPAGELAVVRETSLVFTQKSPVFCHGSIAICSVHERLWCPLIARSTSPLSPMNYALWSHMSDISRFIAWQNAQVEHNHCPCM